MEHTEYIKITKGDDCISKTLNLNVSELKALYNKLVDVLDDYPEMITYREIADKIKTKLEDDCDCENFYGVNDITYMDWMVSEETEDVEVIVEMNAQNTSSEKSENMIVFFSADQFELMTEVNKQFKKKYKKFR